MYVDKKKPADCAKASANIPHYAHMQKMRRNSIQLSRYSTLHLQTDRLDLVNRQQAYGRIFFFCLRWFSGQS